MSVPAETSAAATGAVLKLLSRVRIGFIAILTNMFLPYAAYYSTLNRYHPWFTIWVCLNADYVRPHSSVAWLILAIWSFEGVGIRYA